MDPISTNGYIFDAIKTGEDELTLINRKTNDPLAKIKSVRDTYQVFYLNGPIMTAPQFSLEEAYAAAEFAILTDTYGEIPEPAPVFRDTSKEFHELTGHSFGEMRAEMLATAEEPKSSIELTLSSKGETYWTHKRYYNQNDPAEVDRAIEELTSVREKMRDRFPNNPIGMARTR